MTRVSWLASGTLDGRSWHLTGWPEPPYLAGDRFVVDAVREHLDNAGTIRPDPTSEPVPAELSNPAAVAAALDELGAVFDVYGPKAPRHAEVPDGAVA